MAIVFITLVSIIAICYGLIKTSTKEELSFVIKTLSLGMLFSAIATVFLYFVVVLF